MKWTVILYRVFCVFTFVHAQSTVMVLVLGDYHHCIAQLDAPLCCNLEGTQWRCTIPGDGQAL